MRSVRRLVLACVAAALLLPAPAAQAATLTEVTGFGSNPGNLQMFRYVPDGLPAGRPLVVVMHGCTQTAASVDSETGWTKWADQHSFALLLPQQKTANNLSRCFNWFLAGDQARGQGEPLSIKQMIDSMASTYAVDTSRVFATGLSAGAAMTNIMLAAYPDVFAGGAPFAGIPYKCASSAGASTNCSNGNTDLTPVQWGDKVRSASTWTGPWPRVSVWHGTADTTVSVKNLTETMEQWTNVNGVDQVADVSDTVAGYPHKVYKDASGTARVETFSLTGFGHAAPVDPGTGAVQCGTVIGYNADANICGSYHVAAWFGLTS